MAGSPPGHHHYRFLLHDRHNTFSASLDETVENWGIHVLRSPVRTPTAKDWCERLMENTLRVLGLYGYGRIVGMQFAHAHYVPRQTVS
ncbi:MAG: hypothetical protein JO217_09090 [Acidobacteriaceae bacterium]|nr:hypothetical protein [Acidobacteriaceae bacterium]MBV9442836.1 hypothetical protein [Acidobacteriaceae bacterium]